MNNRAWMWLATVALAYGGCMVVQEKPADSAPPAAAAPAAATTAAPADAAPAASQTSAPAAPPTAKPRGPKVRAIPAPGTADTGGTPSDTGSGAQDAGIPDALPVQLDALPIPQGS
jgi:hypothetical protein